MKNKKIKYISYFFFISQGKQSSRDLDRHHGERKVPRASFRLGLFYGGRRLSDGGGQVRRPIPQRASPLPGPV